MRKWHHLVTDGNGLPLAAKVSARQQHDYSYARVRRSLHRRQIQAVIPIRKDHKRRPGFDKEAYRRRNRVERCVNWLKESRALATRFDKLAVNYLATAKLAILQRFLRRLTPNDLSDRP
jgi:transposase